MTTTKKWGERIFVLSLAALAAVLVAPVKSEADSRIGQDEVLVSAATEYHPTEVFSVVYQANSLPEAFQAAGVDYFPEDKVAYFPDPSLGIGTVITAQRALPVTVIDGKKTRVLRTWQTTVGDFLKEKKIELGSDDKIAPTLVTSLTKNTTITITRVARTNVTETEVVPYQTRVEKDYNQFVGGQTVLKAGKNGRLEKTYLLIREDGELVSKTLLSTKTTEAAVTAVVSQGGLNPVPNHCKVLKDWVVNASTKNKIDPNSLYYRIIRESSCHANSSGAGGRYLGLLQYEQGFWASVSAKAGFPGASIWPNP